MPARRSELFPSSTPVGYWRFPVLSSADPAMQELFDRLRAQTMDLPEPVAGSCTLSADDRARLAAYLSAPHQRAAFCGSSDCRCCGRSNGHEDVSDGTFVWPSGLAHYVADHAVELPAEFVAHVLAGGSTPPVEVLEGWVAARRGEAARLYVRAGLRESPEAVAAFLRTITADADFLASWEARRVRVTFRGDVPEALEDLCSHPDAKTDGSVV